MEGLTFESVRMRPCLAPSTITFLVAPWRVTTAVPVKIFPAKLSVVGIIMTLKMTMP